MPTIHALLIGINAYPTNALSGCINDVKAVETWLQKSFDKDASLVKLRINRITDEDAIQPTRQNIIEGFSFFREAVAGDVCLFYYSGHGSFSAAPEAFWTERDGYLESFVCIDSRLPGGRDLTNKEMGYLIAKTLEGKADVQFVAITDCCHSGTITKAFVENRYTERSMEPDFMPKDLESYLGFGDTINGKPAYKDEMDGDKRKVTVQQAAHIHLAAAQENQTAKERIIDGKQHGAFTYSLLKSLYTHKGLISYEKLMASVRVQVANLVQQQQPVFNLNGGLKDETGKRFFLLNRSDTAIPAYKVYWDNKFGWCVNAGAIHGASVGDTIVIKGVGETKILDQVAPDFSVVISKPHLGGKSNEYDAKLIAGGGYKVKLSFADDVPQSLKDLIQAADQQLKACYVELGNSNEPHYYIRSGQEGVYITLPAGDVPVFDYSTVNTAAEAESFLEKVSAVANWLHLLEVNNPATQLSDDEYRIEFSQTAEAGNYDPATFTPVESITKPIELYYQFDDAKWKQPAFQVTITNTSNHDLWFSGLYLSFDYSINGSSLKEVRLPAGNSTTLNMFDGATEINIVKVNVPKKLMEKGYYDITDYLKLFVSTERIDTSIFSQDGLVLAAIAKSMLITKGLRGIGVEKEEDEITGDWKTETIQLHIVRPKESVQLDGGGANVNGITIQAPVVFSAQLAITSSLQTSTTAKTIAYDPLKKLAALQPFALQPPTRYAEVMDMLELTEVQNADAISIKTPLIVQLPSSREVEETTVIPLGFDQQTGLYYPLGFVDAHNNVHIHGLPAPTPVSATITSKSVIGSIKIYFRKVASDWFGLPNPFPRLAEPDFSSGKLQYLDDKAKLQEKVARANTILIIVHGIIGDTKSIATTYKAVLDEQKQPFNKTADLILTFDYENLQTSIKQTAVLLKEELDKIGIKPGHGKKVVIMAHSMGGLVSRWFIEKAGGHEIVSGLVMFGTPNMGTPWADVRDMAQAIITYAVNGAAFLQPWLFVLSGVGKLAKDIQNTLKEMDAITGIYKELNDKRDPGIGYIIVSGDTQKIIPDYEKTTSLLDRLFKKTKFASYQVLDKTLFNKPNDIAVSVESIQGIPGSSEWKIPPKPFTVACDHMNYFATKEAIKHLQN
jgi:hypothetical protein